MKKDKDSLLHVEYLENRQLLSISNDSLSASQWSIASTSLNEAWNYSTGNKNVVIATIDSGMDLNHEDLKNNVWKNYGEIENDGIDNDNNGFIDDINGWNFIDDNNNVQDYYGHGTHVAGIIGAEGNNNLGVAGVNWNVSIMPLKMIDNAGVGHTYAAIKAIDYLVKMKLEHGVNIVAVNNSWGGTLGFSDSTFAAMQKLNDAQILSVCAAGNSGSNSDITPRYPSSYNVDNIIAVASISSSNTLSTFSNYGKSSVDVAAPGGGILSTFLNNTYRYLNGTSMAAPFIAGTIGLIKSIKPDISMSDIKSAIIDSADQIYSMADKLLGGKINVSSAIKHALGLPYTKIIESQPAPVIVVVPDQASIQLKLVNTGRIAGSINYTVKSGTGIMVKIYVNNRVVYAQKSVSNVSSESQLHNFNIKPKLAWFRRGHNRVRIEVYNMSNELLAATNTLAYRRK